ncbi:mannosyltransferase [Diaporthe australafricana]|uniref:Mannosyltransferase n=1 Tax=Diaporthe australafricana TaxID=127596 RepID=A0ABR3Y1N4_9PEZI
MQLARLLPLSTLILGICAVPTVRGDADFAQVRSRLHKDMSARDYDPPEKYFHESVFHPHYDGRFAEKALPYHEQKAALKNLLQTYLATFSDLGVETWLMHGSLLGWWWGKKILPWDTDADVQVSEAGIHYLANYYNMSVFHYRTPRIPEGRDYMLEVNPNYVNREQTDKLNVIDARWIDTTSGLFIDITTVRYNLTHPEGEGMLSCKDGHEFRDTFLYPLRTTTFEGSPAKIPFMYKQMLESEYSPRSLVNTEFEDHKFSDEKMEWLPNMIEGEL